MVMTAARGRAAADLSPLTPTAQAAAGLPDEQRRARIRAERWIGYSRAREALATLEDLLTHPVRQRMPNLLLIGPTNNGKSMLIEKLHNMLAGNRSVQREFLNLLRFLGNALRVPIVGVGTREAYLAIRSDD